MENFPLERHCTKPCPVGQEMLQAHKIIAYNISLKISFILFYSDLQTLVQRDYLDDGNNVK